MEHNSDFKYDLKRGQEGEALVAKLFEYNLKTIEVKTDFRAHETGNVLIAI